MTRLVVACMLIDLLDFQFAYSFYISPWHSGHTIDNLQEDISHFRLFSLMIFFFFFLRPLVQYMQDLGGEGEVLQLAWRIVNDSLRTDVCLLFPPYEIALCKLKCLRFLLYSQKLFSMPLKMPDLGICVMYCCKLVWLIQNLLYTMNSTQFNTFFHPNIPSLF